MSLVVCEANIHRILPSLRIKTLTHLINIWIISHHLSRSNFERNEWFVCVRRSNPHPHTTPYHAIIIVPTHPPTDLACHVWGGEGGSHKSFQLNALQASKLLDFLFDTWMPFCSISNLNFSQVQNQT